MPGTASIGWVQELPIVQFAVYTSNPDAPSHAVSFTNAPVSGNLLIFIASSGSTLNVPSGWTKNSTLVQDLETSIFSKVSAGTETTITITTVGSVNAT
jgi:hypothetical protein